MILPYEHIYKKQMGERHTEEEIQEFIHGYMNGDIPDYQMSAWLMAIYFKSMTLDETVGLTRAMIASGKTIEHSDVNIPIVDKHSTGGVGDKITLILAPLLSAAGTAVPTITGRGLGFTGGTLDKFESIPGFRTQLSVEEFKRYTENYNLAFGAQSEEIVPADKRIYALRDVTSTVRSLPLITSSILSKKIAEGINSIIFDVKCGSGAFMESESEALELSDWLVKVANKFGINAIALITSMDEPLGKTVGNWVEVRESVNVLRGDTSPRDLLGLTYSLGGTLLYMSGLTGSPSEGIKRIEQVHKNGEGYKKFLEAVDVHGGDSKLIESIGTDIYNPDDTFNPGHVISVNAERSGYITEINAREIGFCGVEIGAGRKNTSDDIDPTAGFIISAEVGDYVETGQQLAQILAGDESTCDNVLDRFSAAIRIEEEKPEDKPVVLKVVDKNNVRTWDEFVAI